MIQCKSSFGLQMTDLYTNRAIEADKTQRYLDAIDLYEKSVSYDKAPSEVYINLSVLYWIIASQFPFRDKFKIPDDLASPAVDKYNTVLDKGMALYPGNIEMIFWRKYFPHRLFYDDFPCDEAISIVKQSSNNSLVPYFFLYLSDKKKYRIERDLLLRECQSVPTAKNLHIISLIDN